jgi:hypothetical protein
MIIDFERVKVSNRRRLDWISSSSLSARKRRHSIKGTDVRSIQLRVRACVGDTLEEQVLTSTVEIDFSVRMLIFETALKGRWVRR